jgi:hypothetical protein
VKNDDMDIPSIRIAINKLHGEMSAGKNKAQRTMVSQANSVKTTNFDKRRSRKSDRFDYLRPLIVPLSIVAIAVWVIVFLLIVVP